MKFINQSALVHFDELPESAFVRLPVVVALLGVSPSTVWRWSRLGRMPPAVKIAGTTMWSVGALRQWLAAARGTLAAKKPSDQIGKKSSGDVALAQLP